MVRSGKRAWLLFSLAALFFFGITNFILGFISENTAADPQASVRAAMILWLGTGILGVGGMAYFRAAGLNFSSLATGGSWRLPLVAGITLALGMLLLKSGLAANPLAKGPIVAVTSSNSLVVATLAWLILGERLSRAQWTGLLIIVAGIAAVSLGGTAASHFSAIGYAVLAMLFFGLTNFILKIAGARGCDSLATAVVVWLSVGACGMLAVSWHVLAHAGFPALEQSGLSWLALLAGIFLALGMLAIKKAVTSGPAGPAAAVSGSNAILVGLLDYGFLDHWLPVAKLAGMMVVIAGIVVLALAQPTRK
ncbi:MAG TPA: DMT family transporter [Candidatus Binatia bacterium]|nr:DMT family transporter [Candidatus Binatia bacterium]